MVIESQHTSIATSAVIPVPASEAEGLAIVATTAFFTAAPRWQLPSQGIAYVVTVLLAGLCMMRQKAL